MGMDYSFVAETPLGTIEIRIGRSTFERLNSPAAQTVFRFMLPVDVFNRYAALVGRELVIADETRRRYSVREFLRVVGEAERFLGPSGDEASNPYSWTRTTEESDEPTAR